MAMNKISRQNETISLGQNIQRILGGFSTSIIKMNSSLRPLNIPVILSGGPPDEAALLYLLFPWSDKSYLES